VKVVRAWEDFLYKSKGFSEVIAHKVNGDGLPSAAVG
jgi:hypothetical protein